MRTNLLCSTAIIVTLLGVAAASAQGTPPGNAPANAAGQDIGKPSDTAPRGPLPGPNATPPQAAAQPADGSNSVQPVPGAMPGSDTVPSTLSEKNAADDKLITVAYTFKNLTDEQRRAIYQALKDHPVRSAFNADIGTELPASMELQAMPDAVVAQVPQTRGYQFAVSDNRVLLVSPPTRIVVGVLPDAKGLETTGGRHSPQQ
ncbi:MAG TPA: DUF1236 domain-containing protein [Xanthobacteraceae bacterium]|nr:DUF1236 domain-containing protein [Xanthobacteraceae bacterium]